MDSLTGHVVPDNGGRPPRMGRRSRWLTAGATVGALALALSACGSSGNSPSSSSGGGSKSSGNSGSKTATAHVAGVAGLFGTLPKSGTPTNGGTITIGQLKGDTPTYAMPIVPSAVDTVYTAPDFVDLYNQPLEWSPNGSKVAVDPSLSMIQGSPTYSTSGGKQTVKFTLKSWKWSNGSSVTGANVVEMIDVAKAAIQESPANWGNYTQGQFPMNVASASATGNTITLQLKGTWNPAWFTDNQIGLMYAFPPQWAVTKTGGPQVNYAVPANAKAIYNYLNKQASDLSTFGTNPLWKISDGPMVLSSFTPANSDFTMTPNPDYPVKAHISKLSFITYTSDQAQFNNLQSGSLDIGQLSTDVVPELPRIEHSYAVYGYPDFGFTAGFYNFEDTTGHFNEVVKQLYFRQAIAHLTDQAGDVRGVYHGAAAPSYGTIPAIPSNPYTPSDAKTDPYPFSVSAASKLLSSHGWKVKPGGVTTCVKPGTASDECGAGIPAGTGLKFPYAYDTTNPANQNQSIALASEARQVGIDFQLQASTFNHLIQVDTDVSAPANKNKWAIVDFGGFTNSLNPTTDGLFNTGGSFNLGGYQSATANSLINSTVHGSNPLAAKNEASYMTKNLPVIFFPNPDLIDAISNKIGGTQKSWLDMTQYTLTPEYWYIKK